MTDRDRLTDSADDVANGTDDVANSTDDVADGTTGVGDGVDDAESTEDASDSSSNASDSTALTHTDAAGTVDVVDVGDKPETARRAVARGELHLGPATVAAIREDEVGKGDVLATARVGAIQAVKHTWETIPLCHQIPITNVDTAFDLREDSVVLEVGVETVGKTGCEMEALQGVSTGLNVVWDMVKAAEKDDDGQYPDTRIDGIEILQKTKRSLE